MSLDVEMDKYRKFLDEVLKPDYLKTLEDRERILTERHEYEVLLVAINKIMESECTSLNTRVNLGQNVFANAEIEKCDKIIVKMMGDLYVELPLNRAVTFVEQRIELLDKRASMVEAVSGKIRAHMDIVLGSLADLQKLL